MTTLFNPLAEIGGFRLVLKTLKYKFIDYLVSQVVEPYKLLNDVYYGRKERSRLSSGFSSIPHEHSL